MAASPPKPDLESLSRRFRAALIAFFVRRTRDRTLAEDLTQEVFARLATLPLDADTLSIRNIEGYVFQMARNLLRDTSRRSAIRAAYASGLGRAGHDDIDTRDAERIVIARQAVAQVAHRLDQLPERTRAIFVLHRMESLSRKEIAEAYGITVSAVEKHLGKAMAHILSQDGSS